MCDGKYVFLGAYMCVCTYVSQLKSSKFRLNSLATLTVYLYLKKQ